MAIKDFFTRRRETIYAYRRLFRTPDGDKVLKDLLDVCGYARSSFDKDPITMAFFEGQRSVILRLVKTANLTEKDVAKLMRDMEQQMEEHNEFA